MSSVASIDIIVFHCQNGLKAVNTSMTQAKWDTKGQRGQQDLWKKEAQEGLQWAEQREANAYF